MQFNDTPIKRQTFLEMSDEQQTAFIEHIRAQRVGPIQIYQDIMNEKREAKLVKLNEQFDKADQAFIKAQEAVDKKIEDLIKKANKLKQIHQEILAEE